LFQDIEGKQKAVSDMQRVIDEPAMGQSDLDQLNHQVCMYDFNLIKYTHYTSSWRVFADLAFASSK
jgi:hypothetical protein